MYEINENTTYEMNNVFSYRGKVTQQQMAHIVNEMSQIIKDNSSHKNGPTVTATYSIDASGAQPVMDIEVLIPLDKAIHVPADYMFKPIFRLNNAVKIRHRGNPAMLQSTANELMQYITDKKLTPITTGYNVTVQEPTNQNDTDNLIVDMYVGVSDNIL